MEIAHFIVVFPVSQESKKKGLEGFEGKLRFKAFFNAKDLQVFLKYLKTFNV